MKKIIYAFMGFVWLVLFGIVVVTLMSTPNSDVLRGLGQYKFVNKQYLDRVAIEPKKIVVDSADDSFVLSYAKYMKVFQDSENAYSAQNRLTKVVLEPQTLGNQSSLTAAYDKLNALSQQTMKSYDMLLKAENILKADIKALDSGDLKIFNAQQSLDSMDKDFAKFRDDVTKKRLAIDKYYKAIIDFLLSKQGEYAVEGQLIKFASAENQAYYEQLIAGLKGFDKELQKDFEKYRDDLQSANSKIPVTVE